MTKRVSGVMCVCLTLCCVVGSAAAADHAVKLQNLVSIDADGDGMDESVPVRVVLVHLETHERTVTDLAAGQTKSIGLLKEGQWAVVTLRNVNGKFEYLGGGVAGVIFPHTLVAIFEMGVDAANDN